MKLILYQRANGTENYPSVSYRLIFYSIIFNNINNKNIIVRLGKFKLITENNINLSSLHLQSLPKLLFKLTFIQVISFFYKLLINDNNSGNTHYYLLIGIGFIK